MTRALLGEAHKAVHQAEHLFTVIYPFTHDTKLLVAILANLQKANATALAFLAEQEGLKLSHQEMMEWLLQDKRMPNDVLNAVIDLDGLMQLQKDCPVEFIRKDRFVLCTDSYNVRTISSKEINYYLAKTKVFIEKTISITAP